MPDFCKQKRAEGHKLILWTCRCGEYLEQAIKWCEEQGLIFDAINENLPERTAEYGGDCQEDICGLFIWMIKTWIFTLWRNNYDRRPRGRPINEKTMFKNGKCRFFRPGKDGFLRSLRREQKDAGELLFKMPQTCP